MDLISELELMKSHGIDNAIEHIKYQKDVWDEEENR